MKRREGKKETREREEKKENGDERKYEKKKGERKKEANQLVTSVISETNLFMS